MTCKHGLARLALIVFISITLAATSFGQTPGSFTGLVTDEQGGALPGAIVTAVHVPTGLRQEATTGRDGRYVLSNLRSGGPYHPYGHHGRLPQHGTAGCRRQRGRRTHCRLPAPARHAQRRGDGDRRVGDRPSAKAGRRSHPRCGVGRLAGTIPRPQRGRGPAAHPRCLDGDRSR